MFSIKPSYACDLRKSGLVVKGNQPALHTQLRKLPWKTVPAAATGHDRGHGRQEQRTLQAVTVPAGLAFPHAAQALRVTRRTRPLSGGKWRTVTVYAITSLPFGQATPDELATWIRGHWQIEALHHIRDVTYAEDASQIRTGSGPQVMGGTWPSPYSASPGTPTSPPPAP